MKPSRPSATAILDREELFDGLFIPHRVTRVAILVFLNRSVFNYLLS